MQVLGIISQKGGSGKTTLALNLAVASEHFGFQTAVFDVDPQASSVEWKDSRINDKPAVISLHAARIKQSLSMAKEAGAKLVIIDTAPHSQKDALEIAQICDLIIIPCKPSIVDLRAISSSVRIAELANKPALAVLTQVYSKNILIKEAQQAIEEYNIRISPIVIGNRIAFVHAFTLGLGVIEFDSKSKASEEIKLLFNFIKEFLKELPNAKFKKTKFTRSIE